MKNNADGHFSEDTLRRYLSAHRELPEEELLEIEEHLGICEGVCIGEVRRQRAAFFKPSFLQLCAGILAHLRQARAAIVVNFQEGEDLLSSLPGFPVKEVLAMAAADEAIEIEEPGLVDFDTASVPPGTMVDAFEETITVVVPCVDPYDLEPPRIELLLEGGEVCSADPKKEQREVREKAGDPESLQEKPCWVARFECVPQGPILVMVGPARRPQVEWLQGAVDDMEAAVSISRRLAAALNWLAGIRQDLLEQLTAWQDQLERGVVRAEAALRAVLSGGQAGTMEVLPAMSHPSLQVTPAEARVRGERGKTAGEEQATNAVEVTTDAVPGARVTVKEDTIVVTFVDWQAPSPPLVVLVPDDERSDPQMADPIEGEGDTWTARFTRIPPGNYLLAIAPVTV